MALFPRFNPSVGNRPPTEAAKAAKVAIADATSRGEPDNFRNNRNFRNPVLSIREIPSSLYRSFRGFRDQKSADLALE